MQCKPIRDENKRRRITASRERIMRHNDYVTHKIRKLVSFTEYELRVSIKNKNGWGAWTTVTFETAKHFALVPAKALIFVDGYLRTQLDGTREMDYHFDRMIA